MAARPEELQANAIAGLLAGARRVAVGMQSPLPGAGALLARELSRGALGVTLLGSRSHNRFTNGGAELFDLAGRGRIDAFWSAPALIRKRRCAGRARSARLTWCSWCRA